jgi:hypothetical protein
MERAPLSCYEGAELSKLARFPLVDGFHERALQLRACTECKTRLYAKGLHP